MRVEIPECKRCCLCVPLRYGILIFGYLNLVFAALVLTVEIRWMTVIRNTTDVTSHTMAMYKGVSVYTQMWLPLVLYSLEIIFTAVLLLGAHMKRMQLIRIYYYYGITTTLAAFITFVVLRFSPSQYFDIIELCLAFSGFVFQIYLLLLIRSEVSKERYRGRENSYTNNMPDFTSVICRNDEPY